jgi:uncharacterized membrane protein
MRKKNMSGKNQRKSVRHPSSIGTAESAKQAAETDVLPDVVQRTIKKVVTAEIRRESWSGPLPPPAVFNQYPVAVQEAMMSMAKSQMNHRQKIESRVVKSNTSNSALGMKLAFWLSITMMIGGCVLLGLGHSLAGLVALFGPGSFQGGNYLFHKWRELQNASRNARRQNESHVRDGVSDDFVADGASSMLTEK